MTTGPDRPTRCANPRCRCETAELTCSLRCGPLDPRQGVRCQCGHETCTRAAGRGATPVADIDLYPPVLDRFRHDRRVPARGLA
jgi:hypothetical protein